MTKKRIYSLDFFKVLMAYVVAIFHMGVVINPTAGVCVDIFAMISGFFLAKKFYSASFGKGEAGLSPWRYTIGHIRTVYPHYLLGTMMLFLYLFSRSLIYLAKAPSWEALREISISIYNLIPDLTMLESAYHFHDTMNYPVWTLSAMIIAGYFIYALLCWNEKVTRRLILPAGIFMSLSLVHVYTRIDLFENYGLFYLPLVRMFGPMSLGVLTYYFTLTEDYPAFCRHKLAGNLIFLVGLLGLILFGNHENVYFITVPVMLLVFQQEDAWVNRLLNLRCFRHCGQLSLAIYCNHALIERFTKARLLPRLENAGHPLPQWQQVFLYLIILTVYSIATVAVINKWKARKKVTV